MSWFLIVPISQNIFVTTQKNGRYILTHLIFSPCSSLRLLWPQQVYERRHVCVACGSLHLHVPDWVLRHSVSDRYVIQLKPFLSLHRFKNPSFSLWGAAVDLQINRFIVLSFIVLFCKEHKVYSIVL